MKREELFRYIAEVQDSRKDHAKILSNLHYTHFYLMDRYKKMLSDYNLTSTQSNVLGIISYFYPQAASLEQIKEMVLEPNSDVSRTVSRLVEKGLAEKVVNRENRRKVSIKVTGYGRNILQRIEKEKKFEGFTAMLNIKEVKTFIKILAKLRSF